MRFCSITVLLLRSDTAIYIKGEQHVQSIFNTVKVELSFRNDRVGSSTGDGCDQYLIIVGYRVLVTVSCELIKNREFNLRTRGAWEWSDGERETVRDRERKRDREWQAWTELSLSEYPYTVTEGQWECCPGSWSDGESVGGGGGGPFRFRQMGGSCLTMLEPTCCSIPMPCCDDVEDTDGRLEPRILFRLVLSKYGTLLLVIGIPPPCEQIRLSMLIVRNNRLCALSFFV